MSLNLFVEKLRQAGLLRIISEPIDIDLEIAHTSYIEVKKQDSKALLFTNPVDKTGKKYPPVLTNLYGSKEALRLIFGQEPDEIAKEINNLLKPKKPSTVLEKINFLSYLFSLRKVLIKKQSGYAQSQEIVKKGSEVDLFELPALKTWSDDAGQFITMGQVYTTSLDGKIHNLGMYRLQIYDKNTLGMHWQIHKDGAHFFHDYRRAGKKMPVSVAIGGDPLYIWCGQAPLPKGIFELLLYGFIRKEPARLVKSITNEIYVPHDVDYVIEGFVDPQNFMIEGPFGDHTGFYTPPEPFPFMKVSAITHKKNPIFSATVVGKPPLEDKYMGWATERVFLPLLQTTVPELIDYNMPENGVFHNLILAKIDTKYPAHAKQAMHAFWGVGQMSFVKHAIFVGTQAPMLDDYGVLSTHILNRFGTRGIVISEGVCDQLDHASPNACFGGKLGIDVSDDYCDYAVNVISNNELLDKFKSKVSCISEIYQYAVHTKSPICVAKFDKSVLPKDLLKYLSEFREHFKILILVDCETRLNNAYMLIWRVVNNIDAIRDIYLHDGQVLVDASSKNKQDGYDRQWPNMTNCSFDVVSELINKGIILDQPELFEKYEIFG